VIGGEERGAAAGRGRHRFHIGEGQRKRLLDQCGYAALESRDRDAGMGVGRREDVHRIELLDVEHVGNVAIDALNAVAVGQFSGRRDRKVTDRDRVGLPHVRKVGVGDDAAADDADAQSPVCSPVAAHDRSVSSSLVGVVSHGRSAQSAIGVASLQTSPGGAVTTKEQALTALARVARSPCSPIGKRTTMGGRPSISI
jgi:hypothetical protein